MAEKFGSKIRAAGNMNDRVFCAGAFMITRSFQITGVMQQDGKQAQFGYSPGQNQ